MQLYPVSPDVHSPKKYNSAYATKYNHHFVVLNKKKIDGTYRAHKTVDKVACCLIVSNVLREIRVIDVTRQQHLQHLVYVVDQRRGDLFTKCVDHVDNLTIYNETTT